MSVCIVAGTVAGESSAVELADGRILECFDVRTPDGPINSVIEDHGQAMPSVGEDVVVIGRVRRRFFRAAGSTVARTELVVHRIEPARRRAAVKRAIQKAVDELDL